MQAAVIPTLLSRFPSPPGPQALQGFPSLADYLEKEKISATFFKGGGWGGERFEREVVTGTHPLYEMPCQEEHEHHLNYLSTRDNQRFFQPLLFQRIRQN